jgi:hypothetical protein
MPRQLEITAAAVALLATLAGSTVAIEATE